MGDLRPFLTGVITSSKISSSSVVSSVSDFGAGLGFWGLGFFAAGVFLIIGVFFKTGVFFTFVVGVD